MIQKAAKKILGWAIYLFWLFLSVLVLLLFAELFCRFFIPDWLPNREDRSTIWQYDELLGWSQKPGLDNVQVRYPQFTISVSSNSMGFRDRDYSLERTEKNRMLVLGDSFVWGHGVEAHERFTDILESRHPDWEIINLGMSGYGTDQEYLSYTHTGRKFKSDLVVLLLYYNDFENNVNSEQYYYPKPYFTLGGSGELILHNNPVPESTWEQKFDRYIETETVLFYRLKQLNRLLKNIILNRWQAFKIYLANRTRKPGEEKEKQFFYSGGFIGFRDSHPITNALLTKLKNTVEADGSRFIVFALPTKGGLRKNLNKLTATGEWEYLDMDPFYKGKKQAMYIPKDVHWNAKGHKMAADIMEDFLVERGVFNRK